MVLGVQPVVLHCPRQQTHPQAQALPGRDPLSLSPGRCPLDEDARGRDTTATSSCAHTAPLGWSPPLPSFPSWARLLTNACSSSQAAAVRAQWALPNPWQEVSGHFLQLSLLRVIPAGSQRHQPTRDMESPPGISRGPDLPQACRSEHSPIPSHPPPVPCPPLCPCPVPHPVPCPVSYPVPGGDGAPTYLVITISMSILRVGYSSQAARPMGKKSEELGPGATQQSWVAPKPSPVGANPEEEQRAGAHQYFQG